MRNKRILSLVLSALVLMPGAVYAKENKGAQAKPDTQKVVEQKQEVQKKYTDDELGTVKQGQTKKEEAEQKKDEKKAQIQEFKTAMRAKHEKMKDLREQTKSLRKDVEKKTEELSSIISDLQAGKKTLSQDMLNQLLAAAQNLKLDTTEIKATAEVSTEAKDTEEKAKKADFNNALASMDKVIAKYQQRLDALKKLNADLDAALAIARLAAAPVPADTTAPAPTQDQQTAPAPTTTTTTTTDSTATSNTTAK